MADQNRWDGSWWAQGWVVEDLKAFVAPTPLYRTFSRLRCDAIQKYNRTQGAASGKGSWAYRNRRRRGEVRCVKVRLVPVSEED